jgi:hypothetical protein
MCCLGNPKGNPKVTHFFGKWLPKFPFILSKLC